MKLLLQKSDSIGALTSSLCLIHCLATPFLFIAQTSAICCHISVPVWWQSVDYILLCISFFMVYRSTQTTSKQLMKPALWLSWISLFLIIINEKINWMHIPEWFIYLPALALVALHVYNLKYCQCKTNNCCANNE